jgi:hypothetical protein
VAPLDPAARDAAAQALASESVADALAPHATPNAPGTLAHATPHAPDGSEPLTLDEARDVCANFARLPLYVRELWRLRSDKAPRPEAAEEDAARFAARGSHALARFKGAERNLRTANFVAWLVGAGLEFWARGAEREGVAASDAKTVNGEVSRVA